MYKKLKQQNFNNKLLTDRYKGMKNYVNGLIRKTKREYITKEFVNSDGDARLILEDNKLRIKKHV